MPAFVETSDFLNTSTALRQASFNRTFFDPKNGDHIRSLHKFLETGNWGNVQFYCEAPYTDVPMTVLRKFAGAVISAAIEMAAAKVDEVENTAQE